MTQHLTTEQIDVAIIPSNLRREQWNRCLFYQEPLYNLPQENGASNGETPLYTVNQLPDAPIIMTGGGCGLNGSLENLFKREILNLVLIPDRYSVIKSSRNGPRWA